MPNFTARGVSVRRRNRARRVRRRAVGARDRPDGQMVPGRQDRGLSGRSAGRRVRQQRLQRLQAGRARSRAERDLLLLRLGPAEDADPDSAGGGDQGGRHCDLRLRRRTRDGAAGRSGLCAGDDLHLAQHFAAGEREEIRAERLRLCRRAELLRRLLAGERSGQARQTQVGRQRLRLGAEGAGRRPRPAHRRRDRRVREGRRQGHLPGDRHGDQRRSERRHGDVRRRDRRPIRTSRSSSPTTAA